MKARQAAHIFNDTSDGPDHGYLPILGERRTYWTNSFVAKMSEVGRPMSTEPTIGADGMMMSPGGLGKLGRILRLVRLQAFDTTTPEGRTDERQRRILLSAAASAVAKAIAVVTALISVPLTLHYLGPERYGMWMIISSFAVIFSFADLGVGNGILNQVAAFYGRDDRQAIRNIISSGFALLSAIAVVIIALFAVIYPHVPWTAIFNITTPQARADAGPALGAFILCFTLAMPLGVVRNVQIGLQQGFAASIWQCVGSLMGLAGVLFAIHIQASLYWLVLAFMGAPLLAAALNTLVFFSVIRRDLSPRLERISYQPLKAISQTGAMFFFLQAVAAVAFASDALVIAQVLGASYVTEYAVPEKLFSLISTISWIFLAQLWPAYGEAIARNDQEWVKRTLRNSIVLASGFAFAASILMIALSPFVLGIWVQHAVSPPLMLLIGLGLWKVVEGAGGAMSMFFNGANILKIQTYLAILNGVVSIILKLLFANWFGVSGTIWATLVAYTLCELIPNSFFLRNYFRNR